MPPDGNICTPLLGKGNRSKGELAREAFKRGNTNPRGLLHVLISHSNYTPVTGQPVLLLRDFFVPGPRAKKLAALGHR